MVYFVRGTGPLARAPDHDGVWIKIGVSCRMGGRLARLAGDSGEDLEVLGVVDGGRAEEQALHRRFAGLCIAGEFFRPGPELMAFIAEQARSWEPVEGEPSDRVVKVPVLASSIRYLEQAARASRMTPLEWASKVLGAAVEEAIGER